MKRTIRRRTEIVVETYEITTLTSSEPDRIDLDHNEVRVKTSDPERLSLVGRAVMKMKTLKSGTAK